MVVAKKATLDVKSYLSFEVSNLDHSSWFEGMYISDHQSTPKT